MSEFVFASVSDCMSVFVSCVCVGVGVGECVFVCVHLCLTRFHCQHLCLVASISVPERVSNYVCCV